MPLQIAIDASRTTRAGPTGTERYALRLIQALIQANESRSEPFLLWLYFRDDPPADLFAESAYVKTIALKSPRLWTHLRWAAALWKAKPDISFVPAHTLPFFFPGKGILTVHDLGYKHFPDAHPVLQRRHLDITTRYSQARAALVLADSQATADDLRRFYSTPAEKIRIVYPGVDALDIKSATEAIDSVRTKYRLPRRYFVFIGTLQPRKNIRRLVQAFVRWQRERDSNEAALVLAGAKGWLFDETWLEGASNVYVTGYIDEADKGGLLTGSIGLIFPSLYEGFGFPVVEAMHCGTPVIASNTSSLPELVGGAGLMVNPLDVSEIAEAMRRCSEDEALRRQLVERGLQRAERFSWGAAAAQIMDAFDEVGKRGNAGRSGI
jgi:glycosyltransferase involved in cell wall biosynthesis